METQLEQVDSPEPGNGVWASQSLCIKQKSIVSIGLATDFLIQRAHSMNPSIQINALFWPLRILPRISKHE